ncbi:MAG: transposase [Ardenticatenaceae bacterium]
MSVTKAKKSEAETAERGQFWRATLLDTDSRLRVARGIAKTETQASDEVFRTRQRRAHPDSPPPTISDGWGGIALAMLDVYGKPPPYGGRGRPPTRKQPGADWQYLQMIKQRDERGRVRAVKLHVVWGRPAQVLALLGTSTAYLERSHLTSRLFNGRQARKTVAFSKNLHAYRAAATWEDGYYNLVRPHKSLRLPLPQALPQKWIRRTPAMAAGLTTSIWSVKELLTTLPLSRRINT